MRHTERLLRPWPVAILGLLLVAGCQPAGRYGPVPSRPSRAVSTTAGQNTPTQPEVKAPPPLPDDYVWMEPKRSDMELPVPIVFVHEGSQPAEWNRLKSFWTEEPTPSEQAAALTTIAPFNVIGLAVQSARVVKVKVPLGLDDPTPFLPPYNPPTLGKWELGKRLFFDKEVFLQPATASKTHSCATCHDPARGYTDGRPMAAGSIFNTPTLINSVYNTALFWDGRAAALEEVVQRSLEDERDIPTATASNRHSWTGVVQRLRGRPEYEAQFKRVFGTPPTQDAVGKALATYMRTILVGNSVHDRAVRAMKERTKDRGPLPEARDFESVLDDAAVKKLESQGDPLNKTEASQRLQQAAMLFSARGAARCVQCHSGANFTDNDFHNLGIDEASRKPTPGKETGRFAVLPPGLKDRRSIGAYKTPTLRALPRTGPFFHNGSGFGEEALFFAVLEHIRKKDSPFIDPELRPVKLSEDQVRALVVFLKALDGDPIPAVLTE
ncbi:MAG: hypothetical protein K2R98_02795 [Gemmataceae bacterium]|nr:hypothetical protein [Gemmataceae bacterium]